MNSVFFLFKLRFLIIDIKYGNINFSVTSILTIPGSNLQSVFFDAGGHSVFTSPSGYVYGILRNPALRFTTAAKFVIHSLGTVSVDSRLATGYPFGFQLILNITNSPVDENLWVIFVWK